MVEQQYALTRIQFLGALLDAKMGEREDLSMGCGNRW